MSQNPPLLSTAVDPDDLENNSSGNPSLHQVMQARLHRRHVLKSGVGAMTMAGLTSLSLSACGGSDDPAPTTPPATTPPPTATKEVVLGFTAVNKSLTDRVTVPDGYTATVVYATGDSIDPLVTDYKNDGTDDNFAKRAGDHHDGMHFFGLNAAGAPDAAATDRALLVLNHENISGTVIFMHPAGQTNSSATATAGRPEAEAVKEIDAHGVSIIELAKTGGKYGYVKASAFNRRITAATTMNLAGPARGSAFVKTLFSGDGTQTRGTINNCGNGYTPWGTYLTAEENWAGYFTRGADIAVRTPKENSALLRNGIAPGRTGNNRWTSVLPADPASTAFSRWNITADPAKAADGTGDFRYALRCPSNAPRWAAAPTKAPGRASPRLASQSRSTPAAIPAANTFTSSCQRSCGWWRMPTAPTAWPSAPNTWTKAPSTPRASTPTAPAPGSSST
jgi:uncharacterized protein